MTVSWTKKRAWQGTVILLLTVMISLNLRILMNVRPYDNTELAEQQQKADDCRNMLKYVGEARIHSLNASKTNFDWLKFDPSQARVLGHHRSRPGFLTVGIPSIKRVNGMTYLRQTINSLIQTTSMAEKSEIVVLIFLADFNVTYNAQVLNYLVSNLMEYINLGFIQIVQVNQDFYPPLSQLKRNFLDKPDRVKWRSKQVSDFAFMFLHSRNISRYYLQLEDDVICAPRFADDIQRFISRQTKSWVVLDFSELGFIGKLFKSKDLTKLAKYMLTFYDEQPVDWLVRYFMMSMTQRQVILRKPTLFQHMGSTSSFDTSKPNKLKDRFFNSGVKKWKADNPTGSVYCDIQAYLTHTAEMAYTSGSGFFWGVAPRKNQAWTIVFEEKANISRVVVETSSAAHRKDLLHHAVLEASAIFVKVNSGGMVDCKDFVSLGDFQMGRLEIGSQGSLLGGRATKCLRIRVTRDQSEWVLIDQVAIFVNRPT